MPEEIHIVRCDTHGSQKEALVCQHILDGLINKKRVGFFWSTESPENPHPDAWCAECQIRVLATGGEWVGDAGDQLGVSVLCGACYDLAKTFHTGGNPWS